MQNSANAHRNSFDNSRRELSHTSSRNIIERQLNSTRSSSRLSIKLKVTVYSKDGCHLCERVLTELEKLNDPKLFEVVIKDITTDPELYERYSQLIPVVAVDDQVKLAGSALANPSTLTQTLRNTVRK